jgi:predicted MPP superfamily phosphohydrolase
MKLVWLTDIHLNFISPDERHAFYETVISASPDAIILTGDIAESASVTSILNEMNQALSRPIYFVLGNHDFYKSSYGAVKKNVSALSDQVENLTWLTVSGPRELKPGVVLLGQDGWADGRYGDYFNSNIRVNDCRFIEEYAAADLIGQKALLDVMQTFADRDAHALRENIQSAVGQYQPTNIIVLTHVPPFKAVSMHQGHPTGDDFLPFFVSKATGDALQEMAAAYPNVNFQVYAGHTHSKGSGQILDNLYVNVGGAVYRKPAIADVLVV